VLTGSGSKIPKQKCKYTAGCLASSIPLPFCRCHTTVAKFHSPVSNVIKFHSVIAVTSKNQPLLFFHANSAKFYFFRTIAGTGSQSASLMNHLYGIEIQQQQEQQQPFDSLCSGTTRRNTHPLTPILIIGQPLTPFSIYNDPVLCSVYVFYSPLGQPLSRSSLVFPLV